MDTLSYFVVLVFLFLDVRVVYITANVITHLTFHLTSIPGFWKYRLISRPGNGNSKKDPKFWMPWPHLPVPVLNQAVMAKRNFPRLPSSLEPYYGLPSASYVPVGQLLASFHRYPSHNRPGSFSSTHRSMTRLRHTAISPRLENRGHRWDDSSEPQPPAPCRDGHGRTSFACLPTNIFTHRG